MLLIQLLLFVALCHLPFFQSLDATDPISNSLGNGLIEASGSVASNNVTDSPSAVESGSQSLLTIITSLQRGEGNSTSLVAAVDKLRAQLELQRERGEGRQRNNDHTSTCVDEQTCNNNQSQFVAEHVWLTTM